MKLPLVRSRLDLSVPQVMGVLNVTPDSFSDGGRFVDREAALRRVSAMVEEGATIIDVGGESTRPGAEAVGEAEELDRVIPVVERIRNEFDCVISVDTMKPGVMREACRAGAEMVNDVNALRADGAVGAVRESGAAAIVMHMQGEPRTMQREPHYEDVVAEVLAFLLQRVTDLESAGLARERLLIDPGFGFGKTLEHNLSLFAALGEFAGTGLPLVVGVSRKSMFKQLLGLPVDRRLHAGLAAASVGAWLGAAIIRTHDVGPTVEALRFVSALRRAGADRPGPANG